MLFKSFANLRARFFDSLTHRKDIDIILSQAPEPTALVNIRTAWLFDLIDWIRREGSLKHDLDFSSGAPQAARVRYLLQVLDRNAAWKKNTAIVLRSIIKDCEGLELFIEVGLFSQDHFLGEFVNRLNEKWLPQVPRDSDLAYIFKQNFQGQEDFEWIRLLDEPTFVRIIDLFHFQDADESVLEENWNSLKKDCEQALLLLSVQVQGLGLSEDLRKRFTDSDFKNSAFYQLPDLVQKLITETSKSNKQSLTDEVFFKINTCKVSLIEVHEDLNLNGVNIQIVYKIERLEHLLKRIVDLLTLLQSQPLNASMLSQFIQKLISETIQKKSLFSFFNQIFALLSRKIVERHAETGEHYISRNPSEHLHSIKNAVGGGLVTSITTVLKFLIHHLHFESFFGGLVTSLNYSASFSFMHFCHFSLGTKQPTSTAPALAARMEGIDDPESLSNLTDEIVNIVRSQFAAIFGNIIGVIPSTALVCWIFQISSFNALLSPSEAVQVINSFSILGMTPVFAAFTGFLLWLSSLISGWIENWFTYHKISPALAAHRRFIFIFGKHRAQTISLFFKKNILGIASSISLGFLLGLAPVILQFLGLNIEVRHVTLSTGAFTAALFSSPAANFSALETWLAVAGIISMGIINVTVAFSLALLLAIKARHIQAPKRKLIYTAVLRKLYTKPLEFIWPQKNKS